MKKNPFGGTRPDPDEYNGSTKRAEPPPIIDPAETGNCPAPCEPLADARLFGGDLMAALRHKHRPYRDLFGWIHVTNAERGAGTGGLQVGDPRPTTSPDGTLEKLKAAGIVGLYGEPIPLP